MWHGAGQGRDRAAGGGSGDADGAAGGGGGAGRGVQGDTRGAGRQGPSAGPHLQEPLRRPLAHHRRPVLQVLQVSLCTYLSFYTLQSVIIL
jgi:hypothetical protein